MILKHYPDLLLEISWASLTPFTGVKEMKAQQDKMKCEASRGENDTLSKCLMMDISLQNIILREQFNIV
jgi:hypothetical protein